MPGVQSTEDRRQISRRLIIHAREELAAGNRLQAGEKSVGSGGATAESHRGTAGLAS